MDNIFGVPVTTIMIVVLTTMGFCLLTTAFIALRNRVIFKMAIRNIPRRKAQTVLIMVGLMLATLIIAASLTTGDTIDYSIKASTFSGLGETDETIAFVGDSGDEGEISVNNVPIPADIADQLEMHFANDPDIDGVMPILTIGAPAVNLEDRLSEPGVVVTGVDPARLDRFGGLRSPGGAAIDPATLQAGTGVISEDLAESINVQAGDEITFFYDNQPHTVEVAAVAEGSILTGYSADFGQGVRMLGIAVPLDWLQDLAGLQDQARFIAVSNAGGVEDGVELTDTIMPKLEEAIAGVEGGGQLGVNPIKQDAIEGAESFGNQFMLIFTVLGLFSVAAGILLIFLIFMMLAAERRTEMGMARAVGMKRRHLIQTFIAEGAVYDLGAALIGAAAGVAVAFAIAGVMSTLIGDFLAITPHASWQSLVVAYALGVSVTFVTIIFASVRSSRLNIVQAIRDLPELKVPQRRRPQLRWRPLKGFRAPLTLVANLVRVMLFPFRLLLHYIGWGAVIAAVGVLIMLQGAGSQSLFLFSLGLSLFVLGAALFLRRFLPARLVYTVASAFMLLYWLLPHDTLDAILPDVGAGGPEMFFLSGIFMVTYATLIIMWNAEVIVALISAFGQLFSRWLPAVKTAVAYPLAAKGRTGMTIAMFSLVIFSLVTLTTINRNFMALFSTEDADAGWDISVTTNPSNPVVDLREALRDSPNNEVDIDQIGAIGRLSGATWGSSSVRVKGSEDAEPQEYVVSGVDGEYIENAEIPLQGRAEGYTSDAEVWAAIASSSTLAVIDSYALGAHELSGKTSFAPLEVELSSARTGEAETVTVIGVIDAKVSMLSGILVNDEVFNRLHPRPDFQTLYVKLGDSGTGAPDTVARQIEAALLERGVQAVSINDMIEEMRGVQSGFLYLLQGFMGLGLLVGIAALGVISFRSVVERRQQIGMLRAIGYQRNMIATSFLLESLVIAGLGVLSGTIMAVILSYNLINSDDFSEGAEFTGFVIPWVTIALFIVASLGASALMTWIPARKASSVPIAEALRYE